MTWNFNSPLFHLANRDVTTLAFGHNKRLAAWFFVCKRNGDPYFSKSNPNLPSISNIMYRVAVKM